MMNEGLSQRNMDRSPLENKNHSDFDRFGYTLHPDNTPDVTISIDHVYDPRSRQNK